MNCDSAKNVLTLYLYGELDFNEEEALEQHLESCTDCKATLERERVMHHAMDQQDWQPSAEFLQACRRELRSRVAHEVATAQQAWHAKLLTFLTARLGSPAVLRPLGAIALVAIGFFGGKLWDATRQNSEPSLVRVRNLTQDSEGGVRLVLEEVRQRTMTGRLDDDRVRGMLLAAAADPSDPGLRARSLDVLKDRGDESEVRRALLQALERDANAGVRLKAIEGLQSFSGDPETRRVLSSVLLTDDNPGIRTKAIDLLLNDMQAEVIGTLQELVIRESNPYIRQKSLKALREANASVETF
jgi:hypothetical protein